MTLSTKSLQRAQSNGDEDRRQSVVLPVELRMATSEKTIRRAAYAMIFCVLCDAIQVMSVFPNIPLMVTPGAHPGSFSSTYPLDITSAQYVIVGAGSFGIVVSNFMFGYLADKFGSRIVILILMGGSVVFSIAKYLVRSSYWAFTVLSFLNGVFGGSSAVANGYMCIIFKGDRVKIDTYIGYTMATMVAGRSLGGLFTILFPHFLFLPLLPAAGVCLVGLFVAYKFVLEPGRLLTSTNVSSKSLNKDDEDDLDSPETLDKVAILNVVIGSLVDNIGSLGTVPLAFSPVMYQVFYLDFVKEGLNPVMDENQYRILYSMIAVVCVPVAILIPVVLKKIGAALTCVLANLLTAAVIVALLFTASINPAKPWSFALYSCILYVGFPFTVISNLSTGPILDRLAPAGNKGFIQGINGTLYDLGSGVFPIIFGFITDGYGWLTTMWICFGISILAAVINAPLIFNSRLKKQVDKSDRRLTLQNLTEEEEEMQKSLQNLERVPFRKLFEINHLRALKGQPPLQSIFGTYSNGDDEKFGGFSAEDLRCVSEALERRLAMVSQDEEHKKMYVQMMNHVCADEEMQAALKKELADWVVAYLVDSGWFAGLMNPQLFKGWFIKSFPVLTHASALTEDNIEEYFINLLKFTNRHLEDYERPGWARMKSMNKHMSTSKLHTD